MSDYERAECPILLSKAIWRGVPISRSLFAAIAFFALQFSAGSAQVQVHPVEVRPEPNNAGAIHSTTTVTSAQQQAPQVNSAPNAQSAQAAPQNATAQPDDPSQEHAHAEADSPSPLPSTDQTSPAPSPAPSTDATTATIEPSASPSPSVTQSSQYSATQTSGAARGQAAVIAVLIVLAAMILFFIWRARRKR